MSKSAFLLLIVGLAVGLWLGFNPQAHQQIVKAWDNLTRNQARVSTTTTANARGSKSTPLFRSAPTSPSKPSKPVTLPGWAQIKAVFVQLWDALKRLLASIAAKLHLQSKTDVPQVSSIQLLY